MQSNNRKFEFMDYIKKDFPILGIDYGSKRIGVAISDKLHICAIPVTVYKRQSFQSDISYLYKIFLENNVRGIVLGFPFSHNRGNGWCNSIKKFGEAIMEKTGTIVFFENEDESTSNIKTGKKNRNSLKRNILYDDVSASIILQRTLDFIYNTKSI